MRCPYCESKAEARGKEYKGMDPLKLCPHFAFAVYFDKTDEALDRAIPVVRISCSP